MKTPSCPPRLLVKAAKHPPDQPELQDPRSTQRFCYDPNLYELVDTSGNQSELYVLAQKSSENGRKKCVPKEEEQDSSPINAPPPNRLQSDGSEAELLFLTARTHLNDKTTARIRLLLEGNEIDWDYLFRKAQQNRVTPLICRNILEVCPHTLPDNVSKYLSNRLFFQAKRNLSQTMELLRLVGVFEEQGIPILPFKGPTLAAIAYQNLSLRDYGDLDVLVRECDLSKAQDLLASKGYKQDSFRSRVPTPASRKKDLAFISENGTVRIEVHWRLSGTHFDLPVDLESLWKRLDSRSIAGVTVRSLPLNDLLLYLCLHGARHGFERLQWVSDIAELVRSHPELDWESVQDQARLLGCNRVLALGLHLARELVGANIPEHVMESAQVTPEIESIAAQVREWLVRDSKSSLSLSTWYRYHLAIKERSLDRCRLHLHYYFRYLLIAIRPNKKDYALVPLLESLLFIHYLLRPARLAIEYLLLPLKRVLAGK